MKKTVIFFAVMLVLCTGCRANDANGVQPTANVTVAPTGDTAMESEIVTEEDTFVTDGNGTPVIMQGTPAVTAVPTAKDAEIPADNKTPAPQPAQTPEHTDDGIIHLPEI